mmetsp:Transcript_36374/g.87771  ORF Transcript_36374/g.87771 Transcript_36374/m.87771 type:complete len:212 (-) Transcript_36374:285-920(-)
MGIVAGRYHRVWSYHCVVVEFSPRVAPGYHEHVPMLWRGNLVRVDISHQTSFHPVVDEPSIMMTLIHDYLISPSVKVLDRRSLGIQSIQVMSGLFPRFGIIEIPQYIVIFDHRPSNVTYHQNDLIGDVPPSPDSFVMGIVCLDEWMVGYSQEFEVPFVLGGPSRKRLHLNERLPLIPRRITRDDRFVKFRLVGDVVLGWRPLARAVPEVEA